MRATTAPPASHVSVNAPGGASRRALTDPTATADPGPTWQGAAASRLASPSSCAMTSLRLRRSGASFTSQISASNRIARLYTRRVKRAATRQGRVARLEHFVRRLRPAGPIDDGPRDGGPRLIELPEGHTAARRRAAGALAPQPARLDARLQRRGLDRWVASIATTGPARSGARDNDAACRPAACTRPTGHRQSVVGPGGTSRCRARRNRQRLQSELAHKRRGLIRQRLPRREAMPHVPVVDVPVRRRRRNPRAPGVLAVKHSLNSTQRKPLTSRADLVAAAPGDQGSDGCASSGRSRCASAGEQRRGSPGSRGIVIQKRARQRELLPDEKPRVGRTASQNAAFSRTPPPHTRRKLIPASTAIPTRRGVVFRPHRAGQDIGRAPSWPRAGRRGGR